MASIGSWKIITNARPTEFAMLLFGDAQQILAGKHCLAPQPVRNALGQKTHAALAAMDLPNLEFAHYAE